MTNFLEKFYSKDFKENIRFLSSSLFFTALIVIIFSFLFWKFGSFNKALSFSNSLYFSMITITTLGYGDFYPIDYTTKLLCSIEPLIGIIGLGLLVNRIARRQFQSQYKKTTISQVNKYLYLFNQKLNHLKFSILELQNPKNQLSSNLSNQILKDYPIQNLSKMFEASYALNSNPNNSKIENFFQNLHSIIS